MAAGLALLLTLAMIVAPALATPPGSEETAPDPIEQITNPAVAAELPHENLGREEAELLLEGVFETQLENPAGIFDGDLAIRHFLSPTVALVDTSLDGQLAEEGGPLGQPVLLDSTVPLRTESPSGDPAPVDLSLEVSGGDLQPANPLAPVRISRDIGDGILLPDVGVRIDVPEAPENRAASVLDQSVAFVPNVAADTDLVIAPTPTGVETLTHLRSPDAPPAQTFDLRLPAGASLRSTNGGGAEVLSQSGEILVSISAPTAIDATGKSLPVSMAVEGESFTLTADTDEATEYPVLVDPLFQTYEWTKSNKSWESGICNSSFESQGGGSCMNREEWGYEYAQKNFPWQIELSNQAYGFVGVPYGAVGLALRSSSNLTAGDRAAMIYAVPRYYTDSIKPSSYISGLTLSNLRWNAYSSSLSPYMSAGIWDTLSNGWISYYTHEGLTGHGLGDMNFPYTFSNPSNVNGKLAKVMIQATETAPTQNTQLYVGTASVQLGDSGVPTVGPLSGPTGWFNQAPAPITYTASDTGLGAYSLTASDEASPRHSWKTLHGCLGVAGRPCPRQWKSSDAGSPGLKYEPSLMPQGLNYLKVVSEDPVGNKSAPAYVEIKVDHTKPTLALSGTATEQATLGVSLPTYTLKYKATDGDSAAPEWLAPFGNSGEGKLDYPMGIDVDPAGNVLALDRSKKKVVKYDRNGQYLSQFGTAGTGAGQLADPVSIAVNGAGIIWIAEYTTNRIQAFSPQGAYIGQITCGCFSGIHAVDTTSDGALWISSLNNHKVFKYSQATGAQLAESGSIGEAGSGGPTALVSPYGLATDQFGGVYVADGGLNKVVKFDSSGKFVQYFGSAGSGDGQFNLSAYIDVAPSGNVAVVDAGNNRVQEFMPDGTFLRKFGLTGSGSGQLSNPVDIAFNGDGTIYTVDYNNKRIARWAHADYNPQSGAASVEVKLDGQLVKAKEAPGCASKDCVLANEAPIEADKIPVGAHTLTVVATDGVGLSREESIPIETHGDLAAPSVALSGSMTTQGSTTKPSYTLTVNATDPGSAAERKSGVASVQIKVDGKVVDSSAPGCPAGGCSIQRSWTLMSDSQPVGAHVAEVVATDAAGRTTAKTVNFSIARDVTAPTINALGNLYNTPEGWVEQKSYSYTATASDEAGYGVTEMHLKIDGQTVKLNTPGCGLSGGCSGLMFGSIDTSVYKGGAHPAELIVKDGAGNVRKKTWTINVDPAGNVSISEAEDTLEAVDATSDSAVVASTDEAISADERADGNDPALVEGEGALVSEGVYNPSAIETDPEEGFRIVLPETTIEAEPVEVVPAATDTEVVEEIAGVAANVVPHVDLITRPTYNGLTTFANIRDANGSESFSWEVDLEEGQSLVQVDPLDVEVRFPNGKPAMLIAAERAHDAVGTNVPTTLSVTEGNVITLTVDHRGANYVYPIVAGAGWEGGYTQNLIVGPKDELEIKTEQERIAKEQQEALEWTWEHEATGSEELPPGTPSSTPMDPNDPMSPRSPTSPTYLRMTVSPPEMIDHEARKRRSKTDPGWCANAGCDIWNSELIGTWFWNGKKGTPGGFAWRGDTATKCRTDGAWWVDTDITRLSWAGPDPAPYGYGQHLMLFCTFVVSYVSSMGREDPKFQLYSNLYGSGYEGVHMREIEPFILEG